MSRLDRTGVARHAAIVLGALLCSLPASAQDRLLVAGTSFAAVGHFGDDLGPAPYVAQEDLLGGGRYAVLRYYDPVTLTRVGDGRTGAITAVAGEILAVDAARPRIFVRRSTGVWMVDVSTGLEQLRWSGDPALVRSCSLAYSVNVLYCAVRRADGREDAVAIDVASGHPRTAGELAARHPAGGSWLAAPDGRRIYFLAAGPPGPFGLPEPVAAAMDTTTGSVTVSPVIALTLVLDESSDRVYALEPTGGFSGAAGRITVLARDLTVLGAAGVRASCLNLAISSHTRRLYLTPFPFDSAPAGVGGPMTLSVYDADTYASLAPPVTTTRPYRNNECRYVAVLTAPGVPRDLRAEAAGSEVTLTWTNIGGASGFVLEVGFVPGRTDLGVFLGPDTRVSFSGVPPGTYYLRMRGGNESGGGRASAETTLVVR